MLGIGIIAWIIIGGLAGWIAAGGELDQADVHPPLGDVVLGSGDGIWAANVGGSGDSAGSGAAVTIANSATIVTEGDGALGLLAQSVGGGGGVAGGVRVSANG